MSKAKTKYIPTDKALRNPRPLTNGRFFDEWIGWGGDIKLKADKLGDQRVLTGTVNESTDEYFEWNKKARSGRNPIAKLNPDYKEEGISDAKSKRIAELKKLNLTDLTIIAKKNKEIDFKIEDKEEELIEKIANAEHP